MKMSEGERLQNDGSAKSVLIVKFPTSDRECDTKSVQYSCKKKEKIIKSVRRLVEQFSQEISEGMRSPFFQSFLTVSVI